MEHGMKFYLSEGRGKLGGVWGLGRLDSDSLPFFLTTD